jgi:hypothetical protein
VWPISGLAPGTANTTVNYGNLGATLVFVPVGSTNFSAMPDPNRAWVNGPNGADLTDSTQTNGISVDKPTGTVTIFAGNQKIVITSDPSITSTVIGEAGDVQTVMDGPTNAISHIVPTGGSVGLGALASSLGSARAVAAQADIETIANNILSQTLVKLAAAIGTASVTAGMSGSAAFEAILSASGFISGISGINPTIPACSEITRTL